MARTSKQEEAAAKAADIRYYSIPFSSTDPDTAAADKFVAAITAKGSDPALIHCAGGGRAATMWFIKRLVVDHWDVDRAAKEATDLGMTSPSSNSSPSTTRNRTSGSAYEQLRFTSDSGGRNRILHRCAVIHPAGGSAGTFRSSRNHKIVHNQGGANPPDGQVWSDPDRRHCHHSGGGIFSRPPPAVSGSRLARAVRARSLPEYLMFHGIEPVATYFSPLAWTSYILIADAAIFAITGHSRLREEPRGLLKMALLSIPLWLIFEAYNLRSRTGPTWDFRARDRALVRLWLGFCDHHAGHFPDRRAY